MASGKLVLIGGGEDTNCIFNKIFSLAGGIEQVKMAIIPTASSNVNKTIESYKEYFVNELKLQASQIWAAPIAVPTDPIIQQDNAVDWQNNAYNEEIAEKISECNVVYFVGGDQRRYLSALKSKNEDSLVLQAIKKVFYEGGIIAGTSAGSNVQSQIMISGGRSEEALTFKVAYTKNEDDGEKLLVVDGIGLIKNAIIDTHFNRYGRLGRLIEAATLNGLRYGYGIAEKTALIFHSENEIEIFGYGNVTMIDLHQAHSLSIINGFLYLRNIRIHLFSHGDFFKLDTIELKHNPLKENINLKPYYGRDDYYISLDVFGQFEIQKILAKYVLDNEACDVVGIMDYNQRFIRDNQTTLLHFAKVEETNSYFGKFTVNGNNSEIEQYTGINIKLNLIPVKFVIGDRSNYIHAITFVSQKNLHIVVYDNLDTNPILDAMVEIYNSENQLFIRKRTNKFGKVIIQRLLENEKYEIRITQRNNFFSKEIVYQHDMIGYCFK